MDTHSFIVYLKGDGIFKEIVEDIQKNLILQIMNWKLHYQKEGTKRL